MTPEMFRRDPAVIESGDPGGLRGLDAAWAAVEAAMPKGWHMGELKNTSYRGVNASGDSERWLAMAWADGNERTFEHAYADTPADALWSLAAALFVAIPEDA